VSAQPEGASILIVDDEAELADLYAEYLRDAHSVDVAYNGADAIKMLSKGYDVVLIDRRMPQVSGTDVLAALKDKEMDSRVAMVTAVDPDFEIIDLPIDDYLVKPVSGQEIRETVDRLVTIQEYNDCVQTLTSKKLKRNVLEVEKPIGNLQNSAEFDELTAEIERLEEEVEALGAKLDIEPFVRED